MKIGRRFLVAVAAVGAVVALHGVWIAFDIGGTPGKRIFSDLIEIVTSLAATTGCLTAARRERGRSRRAWVLLGAATLSWGAGEIVWTLYELALHREVPFPSLADLGFLGMVPLAVAAILSFPSTRRLTSRLRLLLDALAIAGALLFVSWAAVLGPVYRAGSGSFLERAIGLAYPAGDIVIAAIVLFVATRSRREGRLAFALAWTGLIGLTVADTGFAILTTHGTYTSGEPTDLGWTVGFLFIGLAALRAATVRSAHGRTAERPSPYGTFVPTAAVGVAVAAAAVVELGHGSLDPFLFWNAAAVVAIVLARHVFAQLDNVTLNRDLEATVRVRTADLEQTVRRLAESQRLQADFISNVSHELRTPLTSLIGAASTLLRPELELSEKAKSFVRISYRAATRMARLVEDLLLAAGLNKPADCPSLPFGLSEEITVAVRAFPFADKEIALEVEPGLMALGDPSHLRLALEHLLTNADKFAPPGSTVSVEAHARLGWVEIAVRDQGPGIPPELRERVFDRFFQADGSSTRRHSGVGLGLHLARQLVEGLNGRLWVEDIQGEGAQFRIRLPAPVANAAPGERTSAGSLMAS